MSTFEPLHAFKNESSADRWIIGAVGGIETTRDLLTRGAAHHDHLEMGGRAVNAIIQWRVNEAGQLSLSRWVRWPMVREIKDDTHASFGYRFESAADALPLINEVPYAPEAASKFFINGCLGWVEAIGALIVTRTIFPSTSLPCVIERWEIHNAGAVPCRVRIPSVVRDVPVEREKLKWTAHVVRAVWSGAGLRVLAAGESMTTAMVFSCHEENTPSVVPDADAEWAARVAYCESLKSKLQLVTPDPVMNQLFAFSKLRAAENVLATRGGLMHAPGGFARYLAALWCNDQNEYIGPFFPFLGDAAGNESALNAYRWFATYQNDAFEPLPSSIVAEGRGVWAGKRDRGDAAMSAYGAARWALATGDKEQARAVWPFIRWCLEYCERQRDANGVIVSDSDELEGRFTSGKTNLATSCLTYDALISAALLARVLDEPEEVATRYTASAVALCVAIEAHFGATLEGQKTYRYHEGLERLRAWICFPLTVGIFERAEGTVRALFSPELWTGEGLLTEAGTSVYWDRGTLYALRGVFQAGYADEALKRLSAYSGRRLLGDHVPYAVEAFPEQNQSQLSAESALYCRIFTEGVFGVRPTGFGEFNCTPRLPSTWPGATLKNIHAFARQWNLELRRTSAGIQVLVTLSGGEEVYNEIKPHGCAHVVRF